MSEQPEKPRKRMSWAVPRQISPDSFGAGWKGLAFGSKNHVDIKRTTEYVAMTGASVTTILEIPYPHRICKVEAQHTDADGDDNTTALDTAMFQREKWSTPNEWFILWGFDATVGAHFEQNDLAGREFPPGKYLFDVDTTSGHLMFYLVTIQILNKRGRDFVRDGLHD